MTFDKLTPFLGKAGLILVMVAGLFSVFEIALVDDLFRPGSYENNDTQLQIDRAQCLLGSLPEEVDVFGFMPSLPTRMEDPSITNSALRLRGDSYRLLYLTQYALAPKIIAFFEAGPWVIANFPDRPTGLEAIPQADYTIVKDCQNGIFLLNR